MADIGTEHHTQIGAQGHRQGEHRKGQNIKGSGNRTHEAASPFLGKLHSIQLLRAIAALLVVIYHAHYSFSAEPEIGTESYIFAFGAVGVHIFFVISGFIMVYTTRFGGRSDGKNYDARGFFRRRLMRIYPIYWICIAIYALSYWVIGRPYEVGFSEAIGALLLLPGNAAALIGPAWTLAFEMYFYLCFGVAMMLGLTRGVFLLSGAFIALIVAGIVLRLDNAVWALITSPLLLEFLAGALIAWIHRRGYLPRQGGPALIILAVILFLGGLFFGYNRIPLVVSWGVPSTILVAGLIIAECRHGAHDAVRKLGHFGDSSYALYLIHIIVIAIALAIVERIGFGPIDPILASVPIALVAIILGELLHHRIERPLLQKLNPKRALIPVEGRKTLNG